MNASHILLHVIPAFWAIIIAAHRSTLTPQLELKWRLKPKGCFQSPLLWFYEDFLIECA
jgi:hypothetical protein